MPARAAGTVESPPSATADSALLWPVLDPVEIEPGTLTFAVTGTDPIAERRLVLWSRRPGGAAPLARTTSSASGRFDFGQLAVPSDAIELVVTDEAGDPLAPTPVRVGPSEPRLLVVDEPGSGQWAGEHQIRVHPAVLAGELHVVDDSGSTLLSIPIDAWMAADGLSVEVGAHPEAVGIVQILPDGRHSESVSLD